MSKVEDDNGLFVDAENSDDSSTDVGVYEDVEMKDAEDQGILPHAFEDEETSDEEEQIDDPVVESIPVFMNSIPDRLNQSIHLIQFQGKPSKSPLKLQHLGASIKPESNFMEVSVPINTTRFYDEERTEEWGRVDHHKHVGVLNKTDGGLYAAKFVVTEGQKKLVLVPVDSTAQLRASFKYMDDAESQKLQQKRDVTEPSKPSQQNVHILQSTAKNSKITNDPLMSAALGESLKHVRKFDQEEWIKVQWSDHKEEKSQELFNAVTASNDVKFTTKMSMDAYLTELTK